MQNRWRDEEAREFTDDLGLRVYTSRLLGRDKSLVLHGGGNTSVKLVEQNRFREPEEILYVKGSGWDLEHIERQGFSPVRLAHVQRLARLDRLSDPDMVNELVTHMTRASAPVPSIETILHGLLPHRYVDHTHADAVLAITNTANGSERIADLYGERVVVIPYRMPGFDLAQLVGREYERRARARTIGVVLMNHGIFSFGATARESYDRMIALVQEAEDYLARHRAWDVVQPATPLPVEIDREKRATLRKQIADVAGFPVLLTACSTEQTLAFAKSSNVAHVSQRGPATPDHVIRTKWIPMLGAHVDEYAHEYRAYFDRNVQHAKEPKQILDAAPRVVVDPTFGLATVGRNASEANVVAEIYEHTIDVIARAEALGGYAALPERELFDVEYWDLEQAKLKKGAQAAAFAGEVALVTGAASGIGRATARAFLARAAAVIGIDRDAGVETVHSGASYLGVQADLTDLGSVQLALDRAVAKFGGIDCMVLNAGIFGRTTSISALDGVEWRRVMAVNVDANLALLRLAHPLLKLAPHGGRVVVIGSKNVPAPGPGAAAYSASKAALVQLARVAALEWASDGIRVNMIHPNAVFDTALWTNEVLGQRAARYGMSIEEYRSNNLLHAEVTSRDVGELAAELCGPLFAKTTGAQIPVDGGNERVI